jgi:protein-ribulosamine 3-kinase
MSLFNRALIESGLCDQVLSAVPLADGLSDCWRIETDRQPYCIKWNPEFGRAVLEGQRRSLEAIENTGTLRVPHPYLVGELEGRGSFLVMEWLELRDLTGAGEQRLREGLAQLHTHRGPEFGFECPTFLGVLEQNNSWQSSWSDFFLEQRIRPLLMLAAMKIPRWVTYIDVAMVQWEPLLQSASPSLLHGDLSPANVAETLEGEPVVFDPASYYGDSQMDLALYPSLGVGQTVDKELLRLYQLYHQLQQMLVYGAGEYERVERELKYWSQRTIAT